MGWHFSASSYIPPFGKSKWGGKYGYYHLISGVDFPLLTNEELDSFLNSHAGYEFVGFTNNKGDLLYKLGYYHFFNDGILKKLPCTTVLHALSLKVQKLLHIHQITDFCKYAKGCNWWSITDELAKSLLKEKHSILRRYRFTSCCDEIFLQTYMMEHTNFLSKVYNIDDEYKSCMRLIDWQRGNPYVFKECDYVDLLNSKYFFARKFGSVKVIEEFAKLNRDNTNNCNDRNKKSC